MKIPLSVACAASISAAAICPASAITLANYTLAGSYNLPTPEASEVSAIAYDRSTNSLFVIGDGAAYLTQVSLTGAYMGSMQLNGFSDTEGLAYYAPGQFIIAEERIQTASRVTYQDGTAANQVAAPKVVFGDYAGNDGVEGVTYDPLTGELWAVKEKAEQAIYKITNYAGGGTSVVVNPFSPSGLGLGDLSDIYAMSNSLSIASTPEAQNFLIISQQSKRLVEVNRSGQVVGTLDLTFLGKNDLEGVTMDDIGNIYVTSESARLYVFKVPEASSALFGLACVPLVWKRRRK